jgi:hypothetical protein
MKTSEMIVSRRLWEELTAKAGSEKPKAEGEKRLYEIRQCIEGLMYELEDSPSLAGQKMHNVLETAVEKLGTVNIGNDSDN